MLNQTVITGNLGEDPKEFFSAEGVPVTAPDNKRLLTIYVESLFYFSRIVHFLPVFNFYPIKKGMTS
jgi:hypothetical protein